MEKYVAILALCAACMQGAPASADTDVMNPHNWQLRLRGIDVVPQESSSGTIAGHATAGDNVVPELDISYFFTDHISTELILATSRHDIGWQPGGLNLGHVWALPPTLTAQYHFMTEKQFSPYVGAGVNYTMFYNSDPGTFNKVTYSNSFGPALQAGFDYKLDGHWMLNADVKKIWMNTDVNVNNGAVRASVDLDPWVFGLGFGYRF